MVMQMSLAEAAKVAIEICNNPELKREILCAPGSNDDVNKLKGCHERRTQWKECVESKAAVIIEYLGIEKQLQEKVIGVVLSIGMRMLTWAEYHEGTLGFSREYSVNFLNISFFTQQGIIDNKKAADQLMKDESLNIKQKYKLACLYCFKEHIFDLYEQMTEKEKEEFYDASSPSKIKQPGLVKFWSYYQMDEIDKLKGEKNLDQYRLEMAVKSGSKAAVEYCLVKTILREKKDAIIDAAIETVENRIKRWDDWIVFREKRYKAGEESSWIPSDYYIDILYSLLSKMTDDQKKEFLKKDIEGDDYESIYLKLHTHSRTLEYFLNWPYQDYFMQTIGLMWEFLPERSYADLLLEISKRFEPKKYNLRYGEEKSFDYRKLLKEFWIQSPKHYKRFVFNDIEIIYPDGKRKTLKVGKELLVKLVSLKKFTYEDKKNIELIFADASNKERKNIFLSEEGKTINIGIMKEDKWEIMHKLLQNCFSSKEEADKFKRNLIFTEEAHRVCIELMQEEKWEILDRFVQNCLSSKEEADKFKRAFIFREKAQLICIDFIKKDKTNAAESFIKWSSLPEEEVNKIKKEMIYSENGKRACVGLISPSEKLKAIDQFIKWCLPSEEVNAFKKELVFSDQGINKCAGILDEPELVCEFIDFCLSSEEEVRELHQKVGHKAGSLVLEDLISGFSKEEIFDDEQGCIGYTTKFKGGKWEEVEMFLTWCFSSEEEIVDFKKNVLLERSGVRIHFNLIVSNQWTEAETFFAWLGLSAEEIKKLKKETLFNYGRASEMFSKLIKSKDGCEEFVDYGSKQEAIELLLWWYLTDEESAIEFRDKFKNLHKGKVTKKCKNLFENFDMMIEQRLNDLDEEQRGVKRKSETSSPSKRLRNLKLENREVEYGN